ncbi:Translation factor GUF1-like protein, mitochondrial [Trichoplax sp. H2]|uniref:Translation factor GUF1 homolog, mitochondrial n=1 Tax=Trichoplax adhaerens TaxID=10228 RepID=GUF1_TRIAD|nr:hypothetical protein TRIADDRAFT_56304 [Trichoplax adhaerens]B3RXR7.1 RecName: Full=Translation factor GUF1 homolog, mitochondrial; AltName: Full=Elongation factor 4 homolog; Short=EF-4; AltName: Full=GTPase GUF1 homolog; AltName: Full=Ribosomal back-translocase [Trichoplax adhaerens]EDV24904.1 hypothetical protein TRIADDRAFT_56304 [Trichoplax adhaerens]RDD46818.1 Translation factor GUF1-like protein, mitochondrial [Trichoplax sp. H2]|eukprot:XP_002112794.1 hypothetical protein TRIADDRAFT_56304 [Trichoplax adhaerens]
MTLNLRCKVVEPSWKVLQHYASYVRNTAAVSLVRHHARLSTSTNLTSKAAEPITALSEFPVEKIRNFSIIAHIDHGKSTLADRLLEIAGVIPKSAENKQVLDKLQVERERGITVKAQTASMLYEYHGETYLLNLIDTPGHVDFNYEVSRSLAACQGVLLVVDASQGVQAQTVANFFLAFEADLKIIPVLNKIDMKSANPDRIANQLQRVFDIEPEETMKVSAKDGTGIDQLLPTIIEKIPPPTCDQQKPLKALLFDSWYDRYRGVIGLLAIKDGKLTKGEKIQSAFSKKQYEILDLGILYPNEKSTKTLGSGQVGFIVAGMKSTKEAQIGDTFCHVNCPVDALPGFKPAKSMVYAGLFPFNKSEFEVLRSAIHKLTLNDSSVSVHNDNSAALGPGFRLGFLGLLHMDVFNQRLEQEYDVSVVITSPNVPFKGKYRYASILRKEHEEMVITTPSQFPDIAQVVEYLEPVVMGTIIFPDKYMGKMLNLCQSKRGQQVNISYIDETRVMLKYILPLHEIVIDFYDQLKSLTSGYASFDYEDHGYRSATLAKMEILLNGTPVDALTTVVHEEKARITGKQVCQKLKEAIPRQLYEVAIQATIRGKVVARETIRAVRKDVTAKCYGGDITRKLKLLKRQKEGKSRLKMIGKIEVPKEAFLAVLKR